MSRCRIAFFVALLLAVPAAVAAAPPGIGTPLDIRLGVGRSLMPT